AYSFCVGGLAIQCFSADFYLLFFKFYVLRESLGSGCAALSGTENLCGLSGVCSRFEQTSTAG
ncbi:hypothetical protein M3D57_10405, partial [Corynebacterium sanguinis]|uniref:hypothetical protein n=1 Tax=Corynebacterium sanguinis TaxID=2594913 RepID=UPI00223AECF1